jgi:hypothetical protein
MIQRESDQRRPGVSCRRSVSEKVTLGLWIAEVQGSRMRFPDRRFSEEETAKTKKRQWEKFKQKRGAAMSAGT